MKYIKITRDDGGVSIMGLVPQSINNVKIKRIIRVGENTHLMASDGVEFVLSFIDFEAGNYPVSWSVQFADETKEIDKYKEANTEFTVIESSPISFSNIPKDRTFRKAWETSADTISVNMSKAKEIYKNKLREMRKPPLEALDVEFMLALEKGNSTKDIVERKQALRDVTDHQAIEAATTPEELKQVIREILK